VGVEFTRMNVYANDPPQKKRSRSPGSSAHVGVLMPRLPRLQTEWEKVTLIDKLYLGRFIAEAGKRSVRVQRHLARIAAERASATSPSVRVVQLAAGNSATDHGNSK
jgi:hypothetical protein